jgi:hypothetical protein
VCSEILADIGYLNSFKGITDILTLYLGICYSKYWCNYFPLREKNFFEMKSFFLTPPVYAISP